jgi:hypothetical protein
MLKLHHFEPQTLAPIQPKTTPFCALKLTELSKVRANQSSEGLNKSFDSLRGDLYNWLEVGGAN